MVPTFFLRVRWRLHLRKSRLFFSEIFRLAVLIQGHVQVRVPAFQHVSRVTTGIRLIHCPGLFHIYVVTGHSLSVATTVTWTIFEIRVIISGLHVAVAAGSWVCFVEFLHTEVHFGARLCSYFTYTHTLWMQSPAHTPCVPGIYREKRIYIHMKGEAEMNKHQPHGNPACCTLPRHLMC